MGSDTKTKTNPLDDDLPQRQSVENPVLNKYPSFGSKQNVNQSVLQTHLPKIVSKIQGITPERESLQSRNDHNSVYSTSYNLKDEPLESVKFKSNANNNSKIKHGDYYVGVNYGDAPNQHNVNAIYPQTFPLRENINFIESNKHYDQIHTFDKLLDKEITDIISWKNSTNTTPNETAKVSVEEIKSMKQKIGGYINTQDGVIQRHHDKNPNKTLIKRESGIVTDKKLLDGEKQHILTIHKQNSSLRSRSTTDDYKMVIKNGMPIVKVKQAAVA